MALLSADSPDLNSLTANYGIELLWHPSLSNKTSKQIEETIQAILADKEPLDILCIEGSLVTGPKGSGLYDSHKGKPKIDIARRLAEKANVVVAIGTCASFGGIHAAPPNPTDCTGMQFDKANPGGALSADWRSRSGLPVINLAGCPVHPNTMTQTLAILAEDQPIDLDALNRPSEYFETTVHQGCTRNEYHEYDIEDHEPGGRGCMFFDLGCQGPVTQAPCNKDLWNGRSSKTRAGVPCVGCTAPVFPRDADLFSTPKLGDIPAKLPLGVERADYMAYKNLARAAAPERLVQRKMKP